MNGYEKMREALIGLAQAVQDFMATKGGNFYPRMAVALDAENAALSAPPRQCDVGTADEQAERQSRFCRAHQCGPDCPAWRAEGQAHNGCVLVWAQMPYEQEGEENGK